MLQTSASGLINRINWGPNVFFAIGVTCIAISVVQYFRNR